MASIYRPSETALKCINPRYIHPFHALLYLSLHVRSASPRCRYPVTCSWCSPCWDRPWPSDPMELWSAEICSEPVDPHSTECRQVSGVITTILVLNFQNINILFVGLLPMQIGLPGLPGALPAGAMPMPGMSVMLPGHPNMLQVMQPRFRWCLPAAPALLQAPAAAQPPTHLQPHTHPHTHPQHAQQPQPFARPAAAPLLSLPLPLLFHEWGKARQARIQLIYAISEQPRTQQASCFEKLFQPKSSSFSMYNSFWDTPPTTHTHFSATRYPLICGYA